MTAKMSLLAGAWPHARCPSSRSGTCRLSHGARCAFGKPGGDGVSGAEGPWASALRRLAVAACWSGRFLARPWPARDAPVQRSGRMMSRPCTAGPVLRRR